MGNKNCKYRFDPDRNESATGLYAVKSLSYSSLNLPGGNYAESVIPLLDTEIIVTQRPAFPILSPGTNDNDCSDEDNIRNSSREATQIKKQSQCDNVDHRTSIAKRVNTVNLNGDEPERKSPRNSLDESTNDNNVGTFYNKRPANELRTKSLSGVTSEKVTMRKFVNEKDAVSIIGDDGCKDEESDEELYDELPDIPIRDNGMNNRASILSIDSAYSDKSAASVSSIEFMLEAIDRHIVEGVKVHDVLPYLTTSIDESDRISIGAMGKTDPVNAMRLLISALKKSQAPGKWQEFINALRQTDYLFLVQQLERECENDYGEQQELIRILSPHIMERIYSVEVVDKLFERHVISTTDKDAIARQETPREAGHLLLRCITTKSPNWFEEFVQVCRECNLEDVVESLCPTGAGDVTAVRTNIRRNSLNYCQNTVKQLSQKRNGSLPPPPPVSDKRHMHNIMYDLQPNENKPAPPNSKPPKKKPSNYHENTAIKDNISVYASPHQNTETNYEKNVEYGSRETRCTAMLKRKRDHLKRKLNEARKQNALRREIQDLQRCIDETIGASDTEENVLYSGGYLTTSNVANQHMPDTSCREQNGFVTESPNVYNTKRDYQYLKARIDRFETNVTVHKQSQTCVLSQTPEEEMHVYEYEEPEYIDQEELDESAKEESHEDITKSDNNPGYDMTDDNETETSKDIYNDCSVECNNDPGYDTTDDTVNGTPNDDQSVPQNILNALSRMMDEMRIHVSEEIRKLQSSNMCGYSDGYRKIHPSDQMMVYNASQTYRGFFSPMCRVPSESLFPLDNFPQWGYINWNELTMNTVESLNSSETF